MIGIRLNIPSLLNDHVAGGRTRVVEVPYGGRFWCVGLLL
jgi:hypothetical protein